MKINKFFIFFNIIFFLFLNILYKNKFTFQNKLYSANNLNYYLYNFNEKELFFNISPLKYVFSYIYNIVQIEFNIQFYDKNQNFIFPSNLALHFDLHIICHLKKKNNNFEDSLADIYKNQFFNCKEFFNINEKIKIGIIIYKNNKKISTFYFFNQKNINYKNILNIDDNKFNPNIKNIDNISLYENIKENYNNKNNNNSFLLKNLFTINCNYSTKNKVAKKKNVWYFNNIYNNYFCFCYGNNCLYSNIPQICKYKFYLRIIDKNRFLYNKTEYLLADFLFEDRAPCDAFLLFKEMLKQNMSAHYVTERKDIYNEFSNNDKDKLRIIPINNKQYNITGDTLEKYLNLFLRLKAVVSGAEFYSNYNIFFCIEYITFICLGHGVNYFKPFLYKDYYGYKRYNKIILPSETIIEIAKKYGWNEDNIIKIGLPRWDLFDNYHNNIKILSNETKLINKYIFIMFTWRGLIKGKDISPYYFNNILKILNNYELNMALKKNNVFILISLHHNLLYMENLIKSNNFIKYIKQEDILESLIKSNLIISDFSSVIFDFIYQKKPFIIYIPDFEDPNISNLYTKEYIDTINYLKNNSIFCQNKFNTIEDTVNKIIFYINNNFKIEKKLKNYYNFFQFKRKNNIDSIIDYLKFLD